MESNVLQNIASKLGVNSIKTTRKAEEIVRLLNVQSVGRMLSMSAKSVICLELASNATGITISKSDAIKLSGLTRPQYVSNLQTAEKLLGLSSGVSIVDLCITHSVVSAKDLAIIILKQYEKDVQINGSLDTAVPVYPVTSVLAACKVLKLKVDKRKMYEISRSKRTIFDNILQAMNDIAELHQKKQVMKKGRTRKRTLMEIVEDNIKESDHSPEKLNKSSGGKGNCSKENAGSDVDFEEWKKQILEDAAKDQ